jgi:hypothetical protein
MPVQTFWAALMSHNNRVPNLPEHLRTKWANYIDTIRHEPCKLNSLDTAKAANESWRVAAGRQVGESARFSSEQSLFLRAKGAPSCGDS